MSKEISIGFAGMTHLGLNSAVATAERGFSVCGFDEDANLIQQLNNNKLPITEVNLPELLEKNRQKIKFYTDFSKLADCNVVYISTDVPTDDNAQSDLSDIKLLINKVIENINSSAILVILCQVPPGFTRELNFPKSRLYYQVETLVFGQAIDRALNPERFIVGCSEPEQPVNSLYKSLLDEFKCPILPMRYESAELAKISINCCLVASINVANTLAEICENIGADWAEIVPALKLDKRIGQYAYLAPGLGIAGGNLERDLATVLNFSACYGSESSVVAAWVKDSKYRKNWVLRLLHNKVFSKNAHAKISILGLAYKAGTHSTKNSSAIELLNSLVEYDVKTYDPVVTGTAISALEAVEKTDVLIIMTPWQEFKDLNLEQIVGSMHGKIIIDPFRLFNQSECVSLGLEYFTLGVSNA